MLREKIGRKQYESVPFNDYIQSYSFFITFDAEIKDMN